MSFTTVRTVEERKALVDPYLKNRERLEKNTFLGKNRPADPAGCSCGVSKACNRPSKRVGQERQEKKTDQRRNQLLAKLQDNQELYCRKSGGLRNSHVASTSAVSISSGIKSNHTNYTRRLFVDINPDAGMNAEFLQDMVYKPISRIATYTMIGTPYKKVGKTFEKLKYRERHKKRTNEERIKMENLKNNSVLTLLIVGKEV